MKNREMVNEVAPQLYGQVEGGNVLQVVETRDGGIKTLNFTKLGDAYYSPEQGIGVTRDGSGKVTEIYVGVRRYSESWDAMDEVALLKLVRQDDGSFRVTEEGGNAGDWMSEVKNLIPSERHKVMGG